MTQIKSYQPEKARPRRKNSATRRIYVDVEVSRAAQRLGLADSLTAIVSCKLFNRNRGGKVPKRDCPYMNELKKAVRARWVLEDSKYFMLPTWAQLRTICGGKKTARVRVPQEFFNKRGKEAKALPYFIETAYCMNIQPGKEIGGHEGTPRVKADEKCGGISHSIMKKNIGIALASSSRARATLRSMGVAFFQRRAVPCKKGEGHFKMRDGSEWKELPSLCTILADTAVWFGKRRDPQTQVDPKGVKYEMWQGKMVPVGKRKGFGDD